MPVDNIDVKNLRVTGAHKTIGEPKVQVADDIVIVVTQAFGPGGHSLLSPEVTFDGYPGVGLLVRAAGREEMVYLSPFHGDRRKLGMDGLPEGTKCELLCPHCKAPLDKVGKLNPDDKAEFHAIYLSKRASQGEMVAISDIWGDYHSRIVDNFELISDWVADGGE